VAALNMSRQMKFWDEKDDGHSSFVVKLEMVWVGPHALPQVHAPLANNVI
jgi:hypothetical protein